MEQLRQALARSLSEQWAMEQERTQALAALAHDLKTPLSIVSGSAELLEEDALSPPSGERVDAILRSAGRIRDYMEQLRALTATGGPAEAGGRATAELSALAGGLGGRWARPVRPQGLRFSLDCPASRPCTPVPVRVGPGGAQPAGQRRPLHPGRARCACRRMWREAVLTVAVEDSGPGFSPEALARAGGALHRRRQPAPGGATWAWASPSPARPPAATAGRWSCPTPAGGPGGPSPCPSEEGGAETAPPSCIFPRSALS